MKQYKWTKDLEFGIKKIDDQHRHIVELVNNFFKINKESFSRDDVIDIFNDIISYSHDHFLSEEKILKKNNYPELEEQIVEHQDLLLKINNLFLDFSEQKTEQTIEGIGELLKTWIEDHLMRVDKKYVNFLLKKK